MKIQDFKHKKQQQKKISMLTCYDYSSACLIAQTGVDCVLVGDSVVMVMYGEDTTIMATLDMMISHTKAVAKGLSQQFLVTDLPFLYARTSRSELISAVRKILQAGAHAVKIEGGDPHIYETITLLVSAGIPVMGHIGLTPQFIHQLGGYKIQGKNDAEIAKLQKQAQDLEAAGCFAVVLECIPVTVAETITKAITIPTIGIGAGHLTDGQILVWHDVLGLHTELNPKFARSFANTKDSMLEAIRLYVQAVNNQHFPTLDEAFT